MCSIVGCVPGPCSGECFKLPDDPERRHAWVQFLFEVNGSRLKGSNWTDINICGEHFTEDCFINPSPSTGKLQLKSGAVPSVRVKPQCVEMAEDEEGQSQDEDGGDLDAKRGLKIRELCTECGSFYSHKSHKCQHKKKPFSCSMCGTRCVSEISLKNHSKIHNETYDHSCKYCHATFRKKGDKLKHEQTHRGCESPYKCPYCPKMFVSSKERYAHMSKYRYREEVQCEVCGMKFKDSHHLRRHSVVHTGLKPYKCTVCQRDFNQQSNLKSHMRVHTGEKPFQCQHCYQCFNHNVSLKGHIKRYHTKKVGNDENKGKRQKLDNNSGGAEDNGDTKN